MDAQPGDELLDGGWFTTEELAECSGWTRRRCAAGGPADPGKGHRSSACPRG